MQKQGLVFYVTVKVLDACSLGLVIARLGDSEVSNVNAGNLSQHAPAEQWVVSVLVLVLDAVARVNVHEHWVDKVRQTRHAGPLKCTSIHNSFAIGTHSEVDRCAQVLVKVLSAFMLVELLRLHKRNGLQFGCLLLVFACLLEVTSTTEVSFFERWIVSLVSGDQFVSDGRRRWALETRSFVVLPLAPGWLDFHYDFRDA